MPRPQMLVDEGDPLSEKEQMNQDEFRIFDITCTTWNREKGSHLLNSLTSRVLNVKYAKNVKTAENSKPGNVQSVAIKTSPSSQATI